MEDTLRQRIKYLIEHGELYPVEKPAERNLFIKAVIVILVLQVIDIAVSIAHHIR